MPLALDPVVKFYLQHHLVSWHGRSMAAPIYIGMPEQLSSAAKISDSETVSQCLGKEGVPISYPNLPDRSFLVACVDRWSDEEVYGVYSFQQMLEFYEFRSEPTVRSIEWKVLEIPKVVECELIEGLRSKKNCTSYLESACNNFVRLANRSLQWLHL